MILLKFDRNYRYPTNGKWLQVLGIAALFAVQWLLQPKAAQADWMRDWSIVSSVSSERLALHYLLEVQPPAALAYANHMAGDLGLAKQYEPGRPSVFARPILRYDGNINGGLTSDQIRIGGLDFDIAEDSRAKKGMVTGAAVTGQYRLPLGGGFAVRASGTLSYEYAPKWSYGIARRSFTTCLLYTANDWGFIDGCTHFQHRRNEESKEVNRYQSITFGRTSANRLGMTEAALRLQRHSKAQGDQYSATLRGTFFQWGGNLYEGAVTRGQKRQGAAFQTKALMLGVTKDVLAKPTQFQIDYTKEEGAQFFDRAVVDRTYGLRISRPIFNQTMMMLSANRRRSSVSAFSEMRFSLDFHLKSFSIGD